MEIPEDIPPEEDKYNEFKQSANGLQATMSAFANSDGGKIWIGVKDDSKLLPGIEQRSLSEEKAKVNNQASDCTPKVDLEMRTEEDILIVEIQQGNNAPYKAPDGIYIREDGNNKKLDREEEIQFYQETGEVRFEDRLNNEFDIEEDLDKVAFQKFLSEADITDNQGTKNHLLELGLGREDNGEFTINNAGILMFGKHPKRFIPQSEIICGAKPSEDTAKLKDREIIDGPLINMIESAEEFVKRNTSTEVVIEGMKRNKESQYPIEALREAIVNAVVHRSYHNDRESVHLDVLPGKVIISSPGGLLEGLSLENLEDQRPKRRNPKLAELMEKANFAEKMGTGIRRMKELMVEADLPEPIFEDDDRFEVQMIGRKIPLDLEESELNDRQKELIVDKPVEEPFTSSDYQELMNLNDRQTAWKDLKQLVELNILEKQGRTKGTRYLFKSERPEDQQ